MINWFLIYSVAIFLDFVGYLIGFLGVGLIFGRIISFLAGPSFALWFYLTGIKSWGWRLLIGDITEEIPLLGDFLPAWTLTIWRIHKKNLGYALAETESDTVNPSEDSKEEVVENQRIQDAGSAEDSQKTEGPAEVNQGMEGLAEMPT